MKLWVLKYTIGEMSLYLTPHNAFSSDIQDAIKFEEEEHCKTFNESDARFIKFIPSLEEIPEKRNNRLLVD